MLIYEFNSIEETNIVPKQFRNSVAEVEEFPSVKTYSVEELADKHGVPTRQIWGQLHKGIKVELEHTTDPAVAKEIALDHIAELPFYYNRLEKVEEEDMSFSDDWGDNQWMIVATDEWDGWEVWNNGTNEFEVTDDGELKTTFTVKQETYDRVGPKMLARGWLNHIKNKDKVEETGGVGKITAQNTTADVKPGETGRQANKFKLDVASNGTPKTLRP